jgi:glycerol kinase
MKSPHVLAIDQGTTSTRAVVYNQKGSCVGSATQEITQHYPRPGWVEHDADEIWQSVRAVVPKALEKAGIAGRELAAIGLTNQRETSAVWDRKTSRPVARALVWQDRRTADFCREHHADEQGLTQRTGLVLDPYFSATKLRWLLQQDATIRNQAQTGELAWGTIDSFLIWRLTAGKAHATDVTNASRTLLFNLHKSAWDPELCRYFDVPEAVLPQIHPSAAHYGVTSQLDFLPDGIPIAGVAGDQQAALFGQRAFAAGEGKSTYGTGAFFLVHTGNTPILSKHRLLSTFAATLDDRPQYALEGSVFVAGAAVQWLRDGLKLIDTAPAVENHAKAAASEQRVLFVPALVGLGAPHWVPEAQGVIFGLTRGTTVAELARAALEGVAFQVADLIDAAAQDAGRALESLQVDGGMARNSWFLQFQADILGIPVWQAVHSEATALGAAFLAGLSTGVWSDLDSLRQLPKQANRFDPRLRPEDRRARLSEWHRAVKAVVDFYKN